MENKDSYYEKFEKIISDLDGRITELESKVKRSSEDLRVKYEPELNLLREKRNQAEDIIKKLRSSGGEAWKDIRAGLENAAKELSKAFKDAGSKFK